MRIVVRVAVAVVHVRAQQVHDDELVGRRVLQGFFERCQHHVIVLAGILVALVVQVHRRVCLLREGGEHGVALGQGLLVGDPEGLVACLFQQVDQRRVAEEAVRVLLVAERENLLHHFDGVRARRYHVAEHGQALVAGGQRVEVGRGIAVIAIQVHVLAGGRLAEHQYQGAWRCTTAVSQVLQRWQCGILGQQFLHVVQLLAVLSVADQQLPRDGRLHSLLHFFERIGEVSLLGDHLLVERHDQVGHQQ